VLLQFHVSPVREEGGKIGGIFNAVVETTDRVISERRLRTLSRLGEQAAVSPSVNEVCDRGINILAENRADVPFALLYLRDGESARLVAGDREVSSEAAPPLQPLVVEVHGPSRRPNGRGVLS
jgi:hypothetical protein